MTSSILKLPFCKKKSCLTDSAANGFVSKLKTVHAGAGIYLPLAYGNVLVRAATLKRQHLIYKVAIFYLFSVSHSVYTLSHRRAFETLESEIQKDTDCSPPVLLTLLKCLS